jgi:hypothetical protein
VIFALYPAVETRLIQAKSSGWFSIFFEFRFVLILSIPTFRVWFELRPQTRFDLFVMLALHPAAETQMPQVNPSGWFSVFPERRVARILLIPMAQTDGFLSFLVSLASGRAQKRLVSVWSCMLQNRSLLK